MFTTIDRMNSSGIGRTRSIFERESVRTEARRLAHRGAEVDSVPELIVILSLLPAQGGSASRLSRKGSRGFALMGCAQGRGFRRLLIRPNPSARVR
jgi:hypothetical protein